MKFVIEELQSLSFLLCFKKFQVLFYVEPIGIVFIFFPLSFSDQCPGLLALPPLELWQWLDQPTFQLEQLGSCPVTQTSKASVRGTSLTAVRGRWLQLGGGWRRWRQRRRRRRTNWGRQHLPGPDGLHVSLTESFPTSENGVVGDSELHGFTSGCSAAGTKLLSSDCSITATITSQSQWTQLLAALMPWSNMWEATCGLWTCWGCSSAASAGRWSLCQEPTPTLPRWSWVKLLFCGYVFTFNMTN